MGIFRISNTGDSFAQVAGAQPCLREELNAGFDIVLGMNASHTGMRGASIATYGLSGCIAGYIDNPKAHTLFHYAIEEGCREGAVEQVIRGRAGDKTRRVHFFVPGIWAPETGGSWGMKPEARYLADFLKPALEFLNGRKVPAAIHGYALEPQGDARYQGTVWVDRSGELFCEGLPVSGRGNTIKTGFTP
jgi:hypothetical protein